MTRLSLEIKKGSREFFTRIMLSNGTIDQVIALVYNDGTVQPIDNYFVTIPKDINVQPVSNDLVNIPAEEKEVTL